MTFNIDLFRKVIQKYKRFIKSFNLKNYGGINILDDFDIDTYYILNKVYDLIKSNYISLIIYECDIYSIIIFLYYALVLFEPTDDLLYFSDLARLSTNSIDTEKFCIKIAISDEEYCSKIRRLFFNMDDSIVTNKSGDLCLLN